MKKELRDEWCKRLRSGDYVQGRGLLCSLATKTPQYCCLGVLAEILAEQKILEFVNKEYHKEVNSYVGPLRGSLPDNLGILDNGKQNALISMNDSLLKSFKEIADWIETKVSVTE